LYHIDIDGNNALKPTPGKGKTKEMLPLKITTKWYFTALSFAITLRLLLNLSFIQENLSHEEAKQNSVLYQVSRAAERERSSRWRWPHFGAERCSLLTEISF
jgi:hypothetical protein